MVYSTHKMIPLPVIDYNPCPYSKISPTYPWKVPQTFHQQFTKEFLSLWGFGEVWGIFPGYVGKIMDLHMGHWGEKNLPHSSTDNWLKPGQMHADAAIFRIFTYMENIKVNQLCSLMYHVYIHIFIFIHSP